MSNPEWNLSNKLAENGKRIREVKVTLTPCWKQLDFGLEVEDLEKVSNPHSMRIFACRNGIFKLPWRSNHLSSAPRLVWTWRHTHEALVSCNINNWKKCAHQCTSFARANKIYALQSIFYKWILPRQRFAIFLVQQWM